MKRNYILGSMLSLVMASCFNDEIVEKTGLNRNDITVKAVLDSKARVSFEADGDVTHAYWNEGDQITIYDESQGALDYQLATTDEASGTATFAPLGNSVQYTEETVYAIYPATPVVDGVAAIPNTDVWEEGKPMPFAYAYGKMDQSTLVLEFHHHFAYLKLTLNAETVADSENKEITGIQLTNTSATYPIAVVGGKFNFIQNNSTSQGGINSMVFNLKESFTATGDAEKVLYIPVLTQPAGETITINVLSGTETLLTVTKETPESGFVAGNAYAFSPKASYTRGDNTITLSTAGSLSQAISDEEKYTLTSLKIVGPLNGDDIRFIREMAGVDVEGMPTDGKLTDLDISEATIVEGGGYYYFDGNDIRECFTSNDVIGRSMFENSILKKIVLPNNVTAIESEAFYGCTVIEEIVIPESVMTIGDYAFKSCDSLPNITIPNSVTSLGIYVFQYCYGLKEVELGNGLKAISTGLFHSCNSLAKITIPSSVEVIGMDAFFQCAALESIVIPEAVTTIEKGAFQQCSSLVEANIMGNVTTIGESAFYFCSALTNLTLPEGLVSIGDYAFTGCSLLENFIFPETLTTIGFGAFQNCRTLTEITLPNAVTSVVVGAFRDCTSLTNVTLGTGLTEIYPEMFYGCSALSDVNIKGNIVVVDNYAFEGCAALVNINLPETVTTIGEQAFSGCSSLVSIVIPGGITLISNGVFFRCSSLTSIDIPSGVTTIGSNAFEECSSLAEVTCSALNPPTLGDAVFGGIASPSTLFVPTDCTTAYSESDWATYFTTIEGM